MVGLFAESSRGHRRLPTVTFRVLYCFFVIEHERRKILHCNVTQFPTSEWIVQQLQEAFPEPCRYRYVILDGDRKFDEEVLTFLRATGLKAKRTSVQSPWQNGLAERWIGSCRREMLEAVSEGTKMAAPQGGHPAISRWHRLVPLRRAQGRREVPRHRGGSDRE